MTRERPQWPVLLVLALFCTLGVVRHLHMFGEDLASSYVGCQLVATGQGSHLYSHDPVDFSKVGDPVWNAVALAHGYTELKQLHPYVQTPLWAWSLQPLCLGLPFRLFCDLFIVLIMVCTSAVLYLTARHWARSLFGPLALGLVFAGLYVSEPFKYSIFLAQTHVIFVLLGLLALLLDEQERPGWAGVALALAAAVKVTPGLLLVYWLVTGRWKAALSFVITMAGLFALTFAAVGRELTVAYVHSLASNGNVLLVAFNNQSLAGWWMGLHYPAWERLKWIIHTLPAGVKRTSLLLSVAAAVAGGLLDRARTGQPLRVPPYGGVLTLLAATMFSPIAWTHYYILLVIPVMLLLEAYRRERNALWLVFVAVIFALNLYPISYGAVNLYYKSFSLLRSQFYSGCLTLLALALLARKGAPATRARKREDLPRVQKPFSSEPLV